MTNSKIESAKIHWQLQLVEIFGNFSLSIIHLELKGNCIRPYSLRKHMSLNERPPELPEHFDTIRCILRCYHS